MTVFSLGDNFEIQTKGLVAYFLILIFFSINYGCATDASLTNLFVVAGFSS